MFKPYLIKRIFIIQMMEEKQIIKEYSIYLKITNIIPALMVLFVSGFSEIMLVIMKRYSDFRISNLYFYILHICLICLYVFVGRNVLSKIITFKSIVLLINIAIVLCFVMLYVAGLNEISGSSVIISALYLIEAVLLCLSIKKQ